MLHTCTKHDPFYRVCLISKGGCCAVSQFKNIHAYRSRLKMEMYSNSSQNTCEPLPHTRARTCTHAHADRHTQNAFFSFITQAVKCFITLFQSQFCVYNISVVTFSKLLCSTDCQSRVRKNRFLLFQHKRDCLKEMTQNRSLKKGGHQHMLPEKQVLI